MHVRFCEHTMNVNTILMNTTLIMTHPKVDRTKQGCVHACALANDANHAASNLVTTIRSEMELCGIEHRMEKL